jgi:predicted ATP-dependent endonuclease of OLD family
MIKLTEVTIKKFKSIESDQTFKLENNVTVLVGMNESGKTSILEALAKTNYFTNDKKFKFSTTHDYPRKEKKQIDKSGETPVAISIKYEIGKELKQKIDTELGVGVFKETHFIIDHKYDNNSGWTSFATDVNAFWKHQLSKVTMSDETKGKLKSVSTLKQLQDIIAGLEDQQEKESVKVFGKYFEDKWNWEVPIREYIARVLLKPNLPKFLYYDEYYTLPSEISIEKLNEEKLEEDEFKTAKALFELADINTEELVEADTFEDYKAELEATQAIITNELFEYWTTNKNLEIQFDIQKNIETVKNTYNREDKIVEHILHIRVKNKRNIVSLPLKNRSKGFNWFFSFLVWFKKIQEDKSSSYVLLLDEPGLNLHASAQEDLLRFIENLSKDYQIIYTTHSPFMIDSQKLHRVRTVFESEKGSVISDSIQEKDPRTLFPLQAALGYDIAQNLFVSKNNLLIEGVSDLIYLEVMSDIIKKDDREGLRDDITLVPTGGLDKVATFISLLRGSKLNIVCLLDSFIDAKGKARLDDMIAEKIIKKQSVKFFDEYCDLEKADIEDLFERKEYIKLFNEAFKGQYSEIKLPDLNLDIKSILLQIKSKLSINGFNHYRPANVLAKKGAEKTFFSQATLSRFENMFKDINKQF